MTPEQRALRDDLAATPARAAALATADGRDPEAAHAPGEWSPREVLLHLAATEELVWHSRLDALAAEDFPHWPWVEPGLLEGPGLETWAAAQAAHGARRAATLARLDALADAGWERTGHHDFYGILNVAAMLRIILEHDEEHLEQIRNG